MLYVSRYVETWCYYGKYGNTPELETAWNDTDQKPNTLANVQTIITKLLMRPKSGDGLYLDASFFRGRLHNICIHKYRIHKPFHNPGALLAKPHIILCHHKILGWNTLSAFDLIVRFFVCTSVRVCIYVIVYVYGFIYMYICYMHICICINIYIYIYFLCTYVYRCICLYMCVCICVYVYMHM